MTQCLLCAVPAPGGHIGTFAVIYTLGNLVALCSTGFLIGPKRQFKQMFQAKRAQATVAYIVMMVRRGLPRLRASRAASRARSSAAAVCNRDLRFCGRPKDPRAHIHFHAVVRGSQVGPGGCCRERCVARPFGRRCALVWYVASYIPYGRKMLSKIMTKAGSSAMNM